MKTGFYPRLAWQGIARNGRLYIPYILTCVGIVAMRYIIRFLSLDPTVYALRGGNLLCYMLQLGAGIIALFAMLFLFYTHSFLIRRRKMEFGLYNVLGMGKLDLGHILFWETLFIALIALGGGFALGMTLSKLAELGLINILQGEVDYTLTVSPHAMAETAVFFAVTFLLLFLNTLRQVWASGTATLLQAEHSGEKPPRGNWLLGLAGVVILGIAYYIAVTITNPVTALIAFFGAVALVIIATYLIMISGSVVFCRLLQKNKSYYYKPNHFVSVASMTYRMKRNGAGLASICILATMVLVMMSLTTSLYAGGEDTLNRRYPREMGLIVTMNGAADLDDANGDALRAAVLDTAADSGAAVQNEYFLRNATVAGLLENGTVETDVRALDELTPATYNNVLEFCFIPLADYNRATGKNETLVDGEAMTYANHYTFSGDSLAFNNGRSFKVKKHLEPFFADSYAAMDIMPTLMIVVPDLERAIEGLDRLANYNGDPMLTYCWYLGFDTGLPAAEQGAVLDAVTEQVLDLQQNGAFGLKNVSVECREHERQDFLSLNGGLFFLGIFLSIVFLFATVLIIYYKQISEGYEDQARFAIMRKVGMTRRAIRKSINSQMLTVFLLPLALAALHLAFAFPIVEKLLRAFNFDNTGLFALVTLACLGIFTLFYTAVYRLTSNVYYGIVSGARAGEG